MLRLAPNDREFLRHNKLDLTVLVLTVPLLPGLFQVLWVLRLLRLIDMLPAVLGRFVNITLLPYAIVLAFIGVFGGGLAFARLEGVSVFDGIYWANTTINTVGYGDISAQTTGGKFLSMILQWTGNVILAMLIGGVAAFAQQLLLGKDIGEIEEDVEELEEDVDEVEEDVEGILQNVRGLSATDRVILQELSHITARLDEIQKSGPTAVGEAGQMTRQIPEDIGGYDFDLIIVGAGINGAGIARDAAMRGLRTLLLDKEDVSTGTTQWATRLIHGGLRYLEYYEVHLVRESLTEREKLLKIAPHLVKPLRFVVPIYERSKRGPRLIQLGMIGYDVLSFDKSVPNHEMLSREQALEEYPGLNPEGLLGAATYYDGQIEYAERIGVENAISAAEHGAVVLTHARVNRLLDDGDRVTGVEFTDNFGGGTFTAHAPVTVNVAGPWVDEVLGHTAFGFSEGDAGANGEGTNRRMIGGTKGSHIDRRPVSRGADERRPVRRGPRRRPAVLHRPVERALPDRHHRPALRGRPRPGRGRRGRDRLPHRRDQRRDPDGRSLPRGRALHLLGRQAVALHAGGSRELHHPRPRRLRPREGQVRRRRQPQGDGGRRAQGGWPDLHRRRQAHHLP